MANLASVSAEKKDAISPFSMTISEFMGMNLTLYIIMEVVDCAISVSIGARRGRQRAERKGGLEHTRFLGTPPRANSTPLWVSLMRNYARCVPGTLTGFPAENLNSEDDTHW